MALKRYEWVRMVIGWTVAGKTVLGWFGLLGTLAAVLATGATAVWAFLSGMSLPLAIMGGVCMLASFVFLAMVPLLVRSLRGATSLRPPGPAIPARAPLDYSVWRHVEFLTVSQAACLWCEIDPNAEFEDGEEVKFKARLQLMKDAVKQRSLTLKPGAYETHEMDWPTDYVTTTRKALKAWVTKKGWELPLFLQDG